jgi:dTDP-4-amino-4,6-dideoxygalactose transaminase
MEPLQTLAAEHGLHIIEDCAQSFGATRGGRCTGGLGDAGCFSFFPSKNLGACGDGGMITTNSSALASTLLELRNHGGRVPHQHHVVGYNSRLDEIQAVILRIKLERIEAFNQARRRVAKQYSELLADLPGLVAPIEAPTNMHVYNHYTLLLPERDAVAGALADCGVASGVYYRCPLHRQPAFAADARALSLPVTDAVAEQCLSLPMYPELTEPQIYYIADAVRSALLRRQRGTQRYRPDRCDDVGRPT